MTTAAVTPLIEDGNLRASLEIGAPKINEPPSGLPISLFQGVDPPVIGVERLMLFPSVVGTAFSVYMSSGLGRQLEHSIAPQIVALRDWAARHARQVSNVLHSNNIAEIAPEIRISIEEDPAWSQEWVVRSYSLSAEPIDGVPQSGWDDLESHPEA